MALEVGIHGPLKWRAATEAWHPDTRASLGVALAATILVMAGFALLFSAAPRLVLTRDTGPLLERLVLAEPTTPPPRHLRHQAAAPVVRLPQLPIVSPVSPVPRVPPDAFTIQDYLDERRQQDAATLRNKVTASDLQRKLSEITERPALADGQGYHDVDGQKIVRTPGGCAQVKTVQGSSSPTNRIDIAEAVPCPGGTHDESQEIGKAMQVWAEKHRPPPPQS